MAAAILIVSPGIAQASSADQSQQPAASTTPSDQAKPIIVLRLKNNSLLVGRIVREEGDNVIFDAGELGQMTIKKSDIVQQLDPATVAAAFQAAGGGAPPAQTGGGMFGPKGKITWTRTLGFNGYAVSSAYKLGNLDPRFPPLTGKALRLPGQVVQAQSQLSFQRASDHDIWFLDGSDNYTFAENAGKQVDNPVLSGGYNFALAKSDRIYAVSRYTYLRDGVRQIKYSNQILGGVGFKVANGPKVYLDLIPGVAAQYDRKGTPFDQQWLVGGGGLEILTLSVGKFSAIDQRLLYSRAANQPKYWSLSATVTYKGMITKVIGVTFGVLENIDNSLSLRPTTIPANALFPGQAPFPVFANERSQATANMGLLIKF